MAERALSGAARPCRASRAGQRAHPTSADRPGLVCRPWPVAQPVRCLPVCLSAGRLPASRTWHPAPGTQAAKQQQQQKQRAANPSRLSIDLPRLRPSEPASTQPAHPVRGACGCRTQLNTPVPTSVFFVRPSPRVHAFRFSPTTCPAVACPAPAARVVVTSTICPRLPPPTFRLHLPHYAPTAVPPGLRVRDARHVSRTSCQRRRTPKSQRVIKQSSVSPRRDAAVRSSSRPAPRAFSAVSEDAHPTHHLTLAERPAPLRRPLAQCRRPPPPLRRRRRRCQPSRE